MLEQNHYADGRERSCQLLPQMESVKDYDE